MAELLSLFLYLLAVLLALALLAGVRALTVLEHERGLLYRGGRFVRVLGPGRYLYHRLLHHTTKLDMRARVVTIAGQEVLSADNVSLKVSLAAVFRVEDPYRAVSTAANYLESLYVLLQLALRDQVGARPVDELLAARAEIGARLLAVVQPPARELGLELVTVGVKDVMFPGELKNIFAQVVNARKAGLAALERARGESAALRSLANSARLVEANPRLLQLRLLQALESGSGNTLVLKLAPSDSGTAPDADIPGTEAEG